MRRLLQGDVGSGKTVIAALACLQAIENGAQAAFMAPTEILAEQHFRKLAPLLEALGVCICWISGSQRKSERQAAWEMIANGEADLAFGTHALFQEGGRFARLGLAVMDEQHRFGVEQRAALRDKATDSVPDVLVMTATPIPRTAAMTVYGDLDVSVLDELPPGRTPIHTRSAVGPLLEAEVWEDVRSEVAAGRQAYVVCPLIEESDKLEVASAEETLARLSAGELAGLRLGLLHGRLSAADKAATMDEFRAGAIDVLVATTVIEVGVDVPNATIMVILDADRFGIAQLHQLRGRVGRGRHASRCWLVTGLNSSGPNNSGPGPLGEFDTGDAQGPNPRIEALVASSDGFELAEVDLELRGEGTLMSTSQKGRSDLRLASLRKDRELVELARAAAEEIVDADPELNNHVILRAELELLFSDRQEEFLTKS
jgi:ATP-dependent DNA helicase RecG